MADTKLHNYSGKYITAVTTPVVESGTASTSGQINIQRSVTTTSKKQSIQMRFSPKQPTQPDTETQTY